MNKHPKIDLILNIKYAPERFAHVAKHLYNPSECWDQVIPNLGDPHSDACAAGCVSADFRGGYPKGERAIPSCWEHVLRDHDDLLTPAYRDALAHAEGASRIGLTTGDTTVWMFVGDGGVIVIVRKTIKNNSFGVASAYRIAPKRGQGIERENFLRRAIDKLSDKTGWRKEVRDVLG
jgi:hypothetical protein